MKQFFIENWIAIKQLLIGGVAALAHYLYTIAKGEQFSFAHMMINVASGSFVGWLAGQFIPDTLGYHDGIVAIAGISAFQVMEVIEKKGVGFLYNSVTNKKK